MRLTKMTYLAAAISAGMLAQAAMADITGTVKLEGKAPAMAEIKAIKQNPDCAKLHKNPVYEETVVTGDNGELMNVVVSLKSVDGKPIKGEIPSKPLVLDQKGCVYHPHVGACMVGQAVDIKNDDHCFHNVHSLSVDNPAMNVAQPSPSTKKVDPFTLVETFKVKCDVHPWMSAWICVLDNPYFAVTGEDGKFTIDTKGLADGDYTVVAWQEKFHTKEQKVTVKDGKLEKPLDIVFKSDEK